EARFGNLDLWVNNAGIIEPMVPLRDIASADFLRHVEINLGGVFHGTRAFVRHLHRTGNGGVLINLSSGAAWQGYAGWAPYCASKAGVERLTETVQLEEQAAGLRAHAVAPGVVDTGMQDLIRACPPERFPMVERFREMKRAESFNTIPFVALHILSIAFDPECLPEQVAVRLPQENG
ncbi:MAG: SDR family oxidoreductase, partial [Planctomycetota bacterium]